MFKAALKRAIVGSLVAITVIGWTVGCSRIHPARSTGPQQPMVKIAIMPRYSLETMAMRYMPLVKYLSRETGYNVRYISAVGYPGFLSTVEQADADFAFVNPLAYVVLHKTRGAYPLVTAQHINFRGGPPQATYRGVILARTDLGIDSVANLRGKIIAAGPQMAVAGHLAPVAFCRRHGVDVHQQATLIACPTQEDVLHRLQQGRADAGFVSEAIWQEAVTGGLAATGLRPVAYTEPYPGWCICALGDTDPNMAEIIKEKLLELNWKFLADRRALRSADVAGFVEARDEDYDIVRQLLADLEVPY